MPVRPACDERSSCAGFLLCNFSKIYLLVGMYTGRGNIHFSLFIVLDL